MIKSPLNVFRRNVFIPCRLLSDGLSNNESNNNTVIVEKIGAITTIGLNRPEKRNCINTSTAKLLAETLKNFEEDNESYVGIIHGVGGNFCSGKDLQEISAVGQQSIDPSMTEYSPVGVPLRLVKKPLIAAISGYAVAGGLEIAVMCDLRVVEENAILGLYNRRFGIPCINGGTVHLPALIGLSRALDLVLTGRSLTGQEAFQWGLANRVVACGTALGQAIQLAGSLVKFPQKCLLQDRQNLYEAAFNSSLERLLRNEKEKAREVFDQESIDGATKFAKSGIGKHGKTYDLTEKDIPDWEKD